MAGHMLNYLPRSGWVVGMLMKECKSLTKN